MPCSIVLASAIHQHELAIGIPVFLPSELPSHVPPTPPLSAVTGHWVELPVSTANSHWLFTYGVFTYGEVCVSVLFSQIIPPSASCTVFTHLFSVTVSPLLPCKYLGILMGRYFGTLSHKICCLSLDCIVDSGCRNPGLEVETGPSCDGTGKNLFTVFSDIMEALEIQEG